MKGSGLHDINFQVTVAHGLCLTDTSEIGVESWCILVPRMEGSARQASHNLPHQQYRDRAAGGLRLRKL